MRRLLVVALAAAIVSGAALAGPSYLGITGNILTPSDLVLGPGDFGAGMFTIQRDNSPFVIAANVGVNDLLEIGFGHFDPDVDLVGTDTFINFKYNVLQETATMPSLVIGAADVTGELDPNGDPGFFAVIGKSLTPMASNIAGKPIAPLHAMVGVGGGIYDGFFAALDLVVTEQVSACAEYVSGISIKNMYDDKSMLNVGARLMFSGNLNANAALVDGKDFAFGLTYTKLGIEF